MQDYPSRGERRGTTGSIDQELNRDYGTDLIKNPPPRPSSRTSTRSGRNTPARMAESLDKTWDDIKTTFNPKTFVQERDVSLLSWVALGFEFIALIMTLVLYASPSWAWTHEIRGQEVFEGDCYGYYGLWYGCWRMTDGSGLQYCHLLSTFKDVPGWWKTCQALATLMLILGLFTFASMCGYICVKNFNRSQLIISSIIASSFLAAIFGVALFVVFLASFLNTAYWCCPSWTMELLDFKLWYGFILAVITPAFHVGCGVVVTMELQAIRAPNKLLKWQSKASSIGDLNDTFNQNVFQMQLGTARFGPSEYGRQYSQHGGGEKRSGGPGGNDYGPGPQRPIPRHTFGPQDPRQGPGGYNTQEEDRYNAPGRQGPGYDNHGDDRYNPPGAGGGNDYAPEWGSESRGRGGYDGYDGRQGAPRDYEDRGPSSQRFI